MPDSYIEKSFIYLFLLSLLLHLGVFAVALYLPETKQAPPKEPVFIDLQEMPQLQTAQAPRQQETRRLSDRRMRVERETAPKGRDSRDNAASKSSRANLREALREQQQTAGAAVPKKAPVTNKSPVSIPPEQSQQQMLPGSSSASLLKPRKQGVQQQSQEQLFPRASRMAKLEEGYRRKFENEVAEGDTSFLNTEDIRFGSFLRRFENAVYGVWRYPQEAARNGIEGVTPVRITFNREGKIVRVQLLESSGARILDDEVVRTLNLIGPMGSFPKGYDKDEFHLIAFFNYGISRKSLR